MDMDSVPPRCSSGGKFEDTLDEMRRDEVLRELGPRRPEALYKDDDA